MCGKRKHYLDELRAELLEGVFVLSPSNRDAFVHHTASTYRPTADS